MLRRSQTPAAGHRVVPGADDDSAWHLQPVSPLGVAPLALPRRDSLDLEPCAFAFGTPGSGVSGASTGFLAAPSPPAGDGADDTAASGCGGRAKRGRARAPPAGKVEWTAELHAAFVAAVEALPPKQQVPTAVLAAMGGRALGLTCANVASHLQKYRQRKRERGGGARAAAAAPLVPAVDAFGMAVGVPVPGGRIALPPVLPGLGYGAALEAYYPAPGAFAFDAYAAAAALEPPAPPAQADAVAAALSGVLAGRDLALPIGLKLNCTAVAEEMQRRYL